MYLRGGRRERENSFNLEKGARVDEADLHIREEKGEETSMKGIGKVPKSRMSSVSE